MATNSPRLTHVRVDRLLGQFRHDIDFPSEWGFCIIYGPNGVGKTKVLEIIAAALELKLNDLAKIPFSQAVLEFSDGTIFTISSTALDKKMLTRRAEFTGSAVENAVNFKLAIPGRQVVEWPPGKQDNEEFTLRLGRALRDVPVMPIDVDRWRDLNSDRTLSTAEVLRQYGSIVADTEIIVSSLPVYAREFFTASAVYLIETQRLLIQRDLREAREVREIRESREGRRTAGAPARRGPTVLEFARDIRARLQNAMSENSRTSQRLDRSFPRRALSQTGSTLRAASEEAIRERYNAQNVLRKRLADIALIDSSIDLPLPSKQLSEWERTFLWTYLDDTDQKLSTFQPLLDKVQLFQDIVNSRFLFKTMRIDRHQGFRFETHTGTEVSAENLSSGEQHELVLAYNLLFNVNPGSLVLIDEPEISLHVQWQQSFIADIQRISKVSNLRFIVATHSPQIIHDRWDQAVALGPFGEDGADR